MYEFSKYSYYTIKEAINKGSDQAARMRRLSASLLFAYGINGFCHEVAHFIWEPTIVILRMTEIDAICVRENDNGNPFILFQHFSTWLVLKRNKPMKTKNTWACDNIRLLKKRNERNLYYLLTEWQILCFHDYHILLQMTHSAMSPLYHKWAPSSEFVSSSIPSWQIVTAHAQPFRGARDLAFCLKAPLDSLLA